MRSYRRRIFKDKEFIGYNASKNSWVAGLKVHVLSDFSGKPEQVILTPASWHDIKAFKSFTFDKLPKGSIILGYKAYSSCKLEEQLAR